MREGFRKQFSGVVRAKLGLASLLLAMVIAACPAMAVEPDEVLPDPELETRARAISTELRCLVCQNQSIDNSNASLARDLRILVRDRLKAGDSDAAVRAFVVNRYGEFVLLRPPVSANTLLLWLAPILLLFGAIAVIVRSFGKAGSRVAGPAPLDTDEQARLDAILARIEKDTREFARNSDRAIGRSTKH